MPNVSEPEECAVPVVSVSTKVSLCLGFQQVVGAHFSAPLELDEVRP